MRDTMKAVSLAAVIALATTTHPVAMGETGMNGFKSWIAEHGETRWSGDSELWVDPLGNDGEVSEATLTVGAGEIVYTWAYKDAQQTGRIRWRGDALQWQDSWHQSEPVTLTPVPGHGSLIAAEYSYPAGTGPDWHWRIKLAERPDGSLVLQMTNIAPWGEEARAVRTVVRRSE